VGPLLSDWRAWLFVLVLSVLTLISAVAKYQVGEKGLPALEEKFPQVPPERWEKAGIYFDRWGAPLVFLSFLPVMGTIMPSAAGAYGVAFRSFLVWAFLAKMFRYALLLLIIGGGVGLFS